jgi:hypothetical protein
VTPKAMRAKPQHLCLDIGYENDPSCEIVKWDSYKYHTRRIGEENLDQQGEKKYPARQYRVERTLAWLSKYRGLFTMRRIAQIISSQVRFACSLLWYRHSLRPESAIQFNKKGCGYLEFQDSYLYRFTIRDCYFKDQRSMSL